VSVNERGLMSISEWGTSFAPSECIRTLALAYKRVITSLYACMLIKPMYLVSVYERGLTPISEWIAS